MQTEALRRFGPATQAWFDSVFAEPTEVQRRGWERIQAGRHALLVAPTGSGKTLAAFLAGIDSLLGAPSARGVRVLYVSPLKALVYDVERNLRAPLAGIRRTADRQGLPVTEVRVDVRTGDTPAADRRRQGKDPGDILVTTPESLFLLMGSQARETLRTVETLILDEVHALAPTKRGAHLALTLERLAEITDRDPQRIGLSATVRPLDEVARWVGGGREVDLVDASREPLLDLAVSVPVPDMTNPPEPEGAAPERRPGGSVLGQLYDRDSTPAAPERGVWAAILPRIVEEIGRRRTTIVFVNSRGLCERLAQRLNDLAGEELVRAHHGSVSHEQRQEIEESLKAGRLRAIVATSSLELGIDMGTVDCVLLVESPGTVARGLQRVGRSGHGVGEVSVGRIFPKYRGDLLECAVISERMRRAELEAVRMPRNPLDVLSQQIVAMCADRDRTVDEIERIARRAAPYAELGRANLEALLDMLSGRYPSEDFADLRPLLSWDRARDTLSARRGAVLVSRFNAGTIPDRGLFGVFRLEGGGRVGELDEEMVHETRAGDRILLGATTWRVEEITRDRVLVSPAPGEPGRLPFWKGEGPGRPIEIGRAIGAYLRELGAVPRKDAEAWIRARSPFDEFAARNLADYVHDQREHTGALPTDRTISVERFRDELGDWRVCVLTPFGARVHAPWAAALQRTLAARSGFETQVMYSEDGIVLRFADTEALPPLDALLPDPDEVQELVTEQLADTALFAGLFRENAVRSLLLPRRRPQQRNPLWAQRIKAQQLLASVRRYPSFPIVLETYREALQDHFDLPALRDVLRGVRDREIRVHEAETASASPFARSLVFAYVAAFMYEQDQPLAERRAQALTVDPALLRELLGQAELRELIDRTVLQELENNLQGLAEDRRARDADEVHDLLRRLGDLGADEIGQRAVADPASWLEQLERERRAARLAIGGEERWIAAEDAGLYRDAVGAPPPGGLPDSFLDPVPDPVARLCRRFARRRGPFLTAEPAARWDLPAALLDAALTALEREGVLVRGEIRPGGTRVEWCDAEILRRIKRGTLARLRKEVAAVDGRTLGAFLPRWHGVNAGERGADRLLDVIAQLEGVALPWSELRDTILPSRVAGFRTEQLDALSTSGQVLWVGRGARGARDGRVSLHLRDGAAALLDPPPEEPAASPLHAAVLDALAAQGASFAVELERRVKDAQPGTTAAEFRGALWDLAWSGRITNDTFGALDAAARGRGTRDAPAVPRRSRGFRRSAPAATGRWSRIEDVIGAAPPSTERAVTVAHALLDRWGVVSREMAAAEELPGGFASVYRVLRAMEESGQVRRGHFVDGLSGAQFAAPAAVDRLRAARPEAGEESADAAERDDLVVLPAIDPANVWGVVLAWPPHAEAAKPRRTVGSWVVLADGEPRIWMGPRGRQLVVFGDVAAPDVAAAIRALPERARRGLRIERINGAPAAAWPEFAGLRAEGFIASYRGLVDGRN